MNVLFGTTVITAITPQGKQFLKSNNACGFLDSGIYNDTTGVLTVGEGAQEHHYEEIILNKIGRYFIEKGRVFGEGAKFSDHFELTSNYHNSPNSTYEKLSPFSLTVLNQKLQEIFSVVFNASD